MSRKGLKTHKESQHSAPGVKCTETGCDKAFRTKEALRQHKLGAHSGMHSKHK